MQFPGNLRSSRAKPYRLQRFSGCRRGDAPFAAEQRSDPSPGRQKGKADATPPQTQLCSDKVAI